MKLRALVKGVIMARERHLPQNDCQDVLAPNDRVAALPGYLPCDSGCVVELSR